MMCFEGSKTLSTERIPYLENCSSCRQEPHRNVCVGRLEKTNRLDGKTMHESGQATTFHLFVRLWRIYIVDIPNPNRMVVASGGRQLGPFHTCTASCRRFLGLLPQRRAPDDIPVTHERHQRLGLFRQTQIPDSCDSIVTTGKDVLPVPEPMDGSHGERVGGKGSEGGTHGHVAYPRIAGVGSHREKPSVVAKGPAQRHVAARLD
mmetsp:Transcript_14632/g.34032  ORF Transcript_14632/g.34032 Transcript_14632/m.34032 type:complete len:205 (+) Transcript_14632:863-1477(+)